MAKNRKTFEVEALRCRVNSALADPKTNSGARRALANLLEGVLLDTGNYRGYYHLGWKNGGCERWLADGTPDDVTPYLGDVTMRVYL